MAKAADQLIKAGALVEVLTLGNQWNYVGRVLRVTDEMRPMPSHPYVPVRELGKSGGLLIPIEDVRVIDNAAGAAS